MENGFSYGECYMDMVCGNHMRHETHKTTQQQTIHLSAYWNPIEKWAELTVYTPWGNWGYRWNDAARFDRVLRTSDNYLIGKLMGSDAKTLDLQGTIERLQGVAHGDDCLADLQGCDSEAAFWCWSQRWEIPDVDERFAYRTSCEAVLLRTHVVPLLHRLGKSIAWETKQPAVAG